MRIISKFHDFYDISLSHGYDSDIIFDRKESEFTQFGNYSEDEIRRDFYVGAGELRNIIDPLFLLLKEFPTCFYVTTPNKSKKRGRYIYVDPLIVGFCGKIYPCFYYCGDIYYDLNSFIFRISEERLAIEQISREDLRNSTTSKNTLCKIYKKEIFTEKNWKKIKSSADDIKFENVFISLKIPCFSLDFFRARGYVFRKNPKLGDLCFHQVKNPFQCFQDISMFLGNQLVSSKDAPQNIPDDILRDEKGFNKWSFRRHKDEKKKKSQLSCIIKERG